MPLPGLQPELDPAMRAKKVLLADHARITHEMLRRVIRKTPGLRLVGETDQWRNLSNLVGETQADWVIFTTSPNPETDEIVEDLLAEYPCLRIIVMRGDGSDVHLIWMALQDRHLKDITLEGFLLELVMGSEQPSHIP